MTQKGEIRSTIPVSLKNGWNKHILIVDDEKEIADLVEVYLRGEGDEVELPKDFKEIENCRILPGKDGDKGMKLLTINKGKTIPQEKLDHIFEQFFRIDSSRNSESGGSGLGLAVTKEIGVLWINREYRYESTCHCNKSRGGGILC